MNMWSRYPTWAHCSLRTKIKITDFYLLWKVWQEFNTSDPSRTFLNLQTPRSQETRLNLCFQPFGIRLIESSGLHIQPTHCEADCGDVLILWPFFPSCTYISGGTSWCKRFPWLYSPARCQSVVTVGGGSAASERLSFDMWIPFPWLYPS